MHRTVTDPLLATLIERMEHVARGVDELRPLGSLIATLQRDQQYVSEALKQLSALAEARSAAHHSLDKRVVVLERWHKFMVWLAGAMFTVSIAAGGYAAAFVGSLNDINRDTHNRVSALEFIINAPHYERSMAPGLDAPVAAGPPK